MNEDVPTAEDFITEYLRTNKYGGSAIKAYLSPYNYPSKSMMIHFARLHVTAALEAAAEEALIADRDSSGEFTDAIMNSYSLLSVK